MKAITVATHSERYFPLLVESAREKGYELEVLGWGRRWEGFGMKLLLIREYLGSIGPEEIVIYADGFDSLFLGEASELEEKFLSFGTDLVLNAEDLRLYPFVPRYLGRRFFSSSSDLVVVTDMFAGRGRAIVRAIDAMLTSADSRRFARLDDQRVFNRYFFSAKDASIAIDREKKLFFSYIDMALCGDPFERYSIKNDGKRITVRVNGKTELPCVVSGPAGADLGRLVRSSEGKHGLDPSSRGRRFFYYSKFVIPEYVFAASAVVSLVAALCGIGAGLYFALASFMAFAGFVAYRFFRK